MYWVVKNLLIMESVKMGERHYFFKMKNLDVDMLLIISKFKIIPDNSEFLARSAESWRLEAGNWASYQPPAPSPQPSETNPQSHIQRSAKSPEAGKAADAVINTIQATDDMLAVQDI
jgi:hypothetical protein